VAYMKTTRSTTLPQTSTPVKAKVMYACSRLWPLRLRRRDGRSSRLEDAASADLVAPRRNQAMPPDCRAHVRGKDGTPPPSRFPPAMSRWAVPSRSTCAKDSSRRRRTPGSKADRSPDSQDDPIPSNPKVRDGRTARSRGIRSWLRGHIGSGDAAADEFGRGPEFIVHGGHADGSAVFLCGQDHRRR